MLSNLQSETIFLREQLKLKDDHFRDEIWYLWKQLEECLSSLKRDDHDFVSYREILNFLLKKSITATDEPPGDLKFIMIVMKVAQLILLMTTEMLITILLTHYSPVLLFYTP